MSHNHSRRCQEVNRGPARCEHFCQQTEPNPTSGPVSIAIAWRASCVSLGPVPSSNSPHQSSEDGGDGEWISSDDRQCKKRWKCFQSLLMASLDTIELFCFFSKAFSIQFRQCEAFFRVLVAYSQSQIYFLNNVINDQRISRTFRSSFLFDTVSSSTYFETQHDDE